MQSRAIDLENFLANHPLNFLLFYGDYEVINTIYLDDGSPLVDLSMELFNQSPTQTVKFQRPTNSSASVNNHHFSLSLEGNFTLEKPLVGWEVAVEQNKSNSGNIFYFLKKEGYDLQPKLANGSTNKIVLVLKKFRAAPEGGTRTIRAEMFYGPLLKDKDNRPFQDNSGQDSSYGNTIFITNNRGGKKALPLQVGFTKGNAVLNDGTSTNSLELVIANKNWPTSNLPLSKDSQFVISFEMGDTAKEGAVATDTQIKGISITTSTSNRWKVPDNGDSTEWTVKPEPGTTQLAYDETIKLDITNLVTRHSSGSGYLYVRYRNIPNYPDGQFVVAIEKTPLLYRDIKVGNVWEKRVGIGLNAPTDKLHIKNGDLRIDNGSIKSWGTIAFYPNTDQTNNEDLIKVMKSDGQSAAMLVNHEGNVGIGTTSPSAKLHVDGGDAIVSGKVAIRTTIPTTTTTNIDLVIGDNKTGLKQQGDNKLAIYTNDAERVRIDDKGNVGIGTTSPSEKLHVGGNAIVSGKLAIGTTTPTTIDLAIGNNGTGLKQQGDGKLAIYTKDAERVRIEGDDDTKDGPKLHIFGDLSLGEDEDNERFIIHSRTNHNGDFLQITSDDSEGSWKWNQGITLKRNGNLGIGTNDPQATLDVNGSVKLGDGSTGWNRIIVGRVIVSGSDYSQWKVYGEGISYALRTAQTGRFVIGLKKRIDTEKLVVIASTHNSYADNFVSVVEISHQSFSVQTKDKNGSDEDVSFHFIVIESSENSWKFLNS